MSTSKSYDYLIREEKVIVASRHAKGEEIKIKFRPFSRLIFNARHGKKLPFNFRLLINAFLHVSFVIRFMFSLKIIIELGFNVQRKRVSCCEAFCGFFRNQSKTEAKEFLCFCIFRSLDAERSCDRCGGCT